MLTDTQLATLRQGCTDRLIAIDDLLEALNDHRENEYSHDNALRATLAAYRTWWQSVADSIDEQGAQFTVPPEPKL